MPPTMSRQNAKLEKGHNSHKINSIFFQMSIISHLLKTSLAQLVTGQNVNCFSKYNI